MSKKITILISIVIWALYAIGNANILLNFSDITIPIENKVSFVHFMAPGNDFWWSIFRLPSKSIVPIHITITSEHGTQSKTCTKRIRGLYFNGQRGKRIWPLDIDTLDMLQKQSSGYNNLQMTGGLYTTCSGNSTYSIFWAITYTRGGKKSYIVAGTKVSYEDNNILSAMSNSFQFFDNKIPIGYIYDSNGGIGYVGGNLSGHENLINFLNNWGKINSGFMYSGNEIISNNTQRTTTIQNGNNAMETMRNLSIQGSVGLSRSIEQDERLSLLGNQSNKTVIYNGSDINSSTLINSAKQKAQTLCKGKKINPDIQTTNESILCYENTWIIIDLTQEIMYENKTIIVKNGNVILSGGMQENSPSMDIFIDKWLLYLPADPCILQWFNQEGFPISSGINYWLYLKGNIVVNGLIMWGIEWFNHKLHLEGKITTLNTPLQPTTWRIAQIQNMFGFTITNMISLQNVFVRSCKTNGEWTDGSPCNQWGTVSTTPLVILNGNYPSNILE